MGWFTNGDITSRSLVGDCFGAVEVASDDGDVWVGCGEISWDSTEEDCDAVFWVSLDERIKNYLALTERSSQKV